MPLPKLKRVAIAIENRAEYGRRAIRGIIDYARGRGPWDFVYAYDWGVAIRIASLRGCDGLIVQSEQLIETRSREPWGQARVGVFLNAEQHKCPTVREDHLAVGAMACRHLVSLGFRNLGVLTIPYAWAEMRQSGFCDAAKLANVENTSVFALSREHMNQAPAAAIRLVSRWIRTIELPAGLFAANDTLGGFITAACRELGIMVPEQAGVLGVDDDELACRLTSPPLSSIDHNAYQVGYQAAAILDGMMRGERPRAAPVIVPPVGVVTRQSTDSLAVPDPDVALAIRYIRQGVQDGVKVGDLLNAVPASRSKLERAFKSLFGRTINQEILRSRVALAQEQLLHTSRDILDIALACGFANRQHLNVSFKAITGETPTAFRRRFHTPSRSSAGEGAEAAT